MSTSGRSRTVLVSKLLIAFGNALSRTVMGSPAIVAFGGVAFGGVVACGMSLVGRSPGRRRTVGSGVCAGVPNGAVVDIRYRFSYFVVATTFGVVFSRS